MRVIVLTDQLIQTGSTFVIGGWIQSLIAILQSSTKMEIAIIGSTYENSCIEKENNTTYYKVKQPVSSNRLKNIYQRWSANIQFEQVIQEYVAAIQNFNPDIIHLFGTESFICNVIPYVKTAKTIVHLQGLINPYLNAWLPPGMSKNSIAFHPFHLINFLRGIGLYWQLKKFRAMAERELKYFSSIHFVMGRTDWDRSMATLLIKNARYFHLEESLRPDFYTNSQWRLKDRTKIQLISVLSAATYKGFDVILKTAHFLKSQNVDFQWNICGTSESDFVVKTMEKNLKMKYKENNVSFLGKKSSKELLALLLETDIFIHPSYIENSPNSICEAQIMGMPVVATYVGGVSSLIRHNETGILFPANDIYLLAEIIISLHKNPQKMQNIGSNARKAAQQRHDKNVILKNIENIYQTILQIEK